MSIVLVRKLLDWSMSLPLLLFGGTPPAQCFRESTVAMKGNRRHLLVNLTAWASAALIMSAMMILIMWLVGTLIVPLAMNSIQWLLFVLGGVVAIGAVGGFVVAAFTGGSFAYVIADTFFHVIPEIAEKAPVASSVQKATSTTARLTTRKAVLLLVAGVAVAGLTGYWLINSVPINDDVYVIAHRGASGRAPENTIAAIQAAIEDEADWIEIDVQETVDGEIVLLHDSDFMKLAGVDLKIWDGTLQQVSEIDVGGWFAPEFADQRPPTLAEVLQITKGRGRLIIEFKYYGHDERLEERVVELVEQADMVDDVMIMSLEPKGVRKMRELRPDWTVGLLAAQAAGNLAQLDVDFLAVKEALVTPDLILAARNSGKQVFVWTLNDAYSMTRAISIGVDGIITNEPVLARQVLDDRANLTPTEHLLLHTALLLGQQPPTRSYRDDSP
jgi:glycerophosphoryl diester phosphodiesterase